MSTGPLKVNIGSGPDGRSDWINLDWGILALLSKMPSLRTLLVKLHLLSSCYDRPWPGNLRLRDCRRRLPFSDRSVQYIYTSHFIEHLPRYQAIRLFIECRRVLCDSGVLRISVPDLKLLAERYLQADLNFFLESHGPEPGDNKLKAVSDVFVQNFYGYDCYSAPTFVQRLQRMFIRGHLWMYDYESLGNILHDVGFSTIRRCKPGQGRVPDIEYLDIHRECSLFVEASD